MEPIRSRPFDEFTPVYRSEKGGFYVILRKVMHLAGKAKPVMEVRAFATEVRASPVEDGSDALAAPQGLRLHGRQGRKNTRLDAGGVK